MVIMNELFLAKVYSQNISEQVDEKEKMKVWSRQLGVTCNYCHNLENFKDDSKETYKTSLKHQQVVKILQDQIFNEHDKANLLKVKVDCYMCHRGSDKPNYIEPPLKLIK